MWMAKNEKQTNKQKTPDDTSISKDEESNWNSQTLLLKMQNAASWENSSVVSYDMTQKSHLGYFPKRNENLCLYKNLYVSVYKSFI